MRIVDEHNEPTVDFGALRSGDCFKHSGNLYMKTLQTESVSFNAVRLSDGYLGIFKSDTGVRKAKAFVTVEVSK